MSDGLTEAENQYFESEGEAAPEEIVEQEAQVEAQPEVQEDKPPPGYVPHQALHAEREMRKEFQQKVDGLQEQLSTVDELKAQLLEMREAQRQEDIPNFEEDPLSNLEYNNQQLQQRVEHAEASIEEQAQQQQMAQYRENLRVGFINDANQFATQNPDFGAAHKFAMQTRGQQYMTLGLSEQEAAMQVAMEEQAVIEKAFQDGESPSARIYALASQMGFKSEATSLETVKQGIDEAQTLNTSSSSPSDNESFQRLLDADDSEFEDLWNKTFPQ